MGLSDRKDRLMNRLFRYVKSISFHLKWLFMSAQERYAYLWAKTSKLEDWGYPVRNTVLITK
jgi:hypothetical protein